MKFTYNISGVRLRSEAIECLLRSNKTGARQKYECSRSGRSKESHGVAWWIEIEMRVKAISNDGLWIYDCRKLWLEWIFHSSIWWMGWSDGWWLDLSPQSEISCHDSWCGKAFSWLSRVVSPYFGEGPVHVTRPFSFSEEKRPFLILFLYIALTRLDEPPRVGHSTQEEGGFSWREYFQSDGI